jgi:hypothetical protein
MLSPVDDDICPSRLIVKLCEVLTPVTPKEAANGRLLPQLSPLHVCAEAFSPKFTIPVNAVSDAVPVRDNTGEPPKATCGVNPDPLPVCVKK